MLVLRIEIYPVDSGFQRLNYRGLVYRWLPVNVMLGGKPSDGLASSSGGIVGKEIGDAREMLNLIIW